VPVRQARRVIDGILLLDKPLGISSNAALQRARRAFHAAKAGHTGNLDVAATGLLPLCFGAATKVCGFMLGADKRYQALIKLGEVTTTGDAEGTVVTTSGNIPVARELVQQAVTALLGVRMQTPPMYSALKLNGQPLYRLARQGIAVPRTPLRIEIKAAELTYFQGALVGLDVQCSKGTYIRVLAEELGEQLGCGAHLQALRRISTGPFDLSQAVTLATVEDFAGDLARLDELLLPLDSALRDFASVQIDDAAARAFLQGQRLPPQATPVTATDWVRVYGKDDNFLGLGVREADGALRPKRIMHGIQAPNRN